MRRSSSASTGPASDAGVVFPLVGGERSSLATGQRIVAAATARIDTATHEAARDEQQWRTQYLPHFRELTRLSAHQHGSLIAIDGAQAVHAEMRHRRHGAETSLLAALETPRADFLHSHQITGDLRRSDRTLTVPREDGDLSGEALQRQLDRWTTAGVAEPSFGLALEKVVQNPEWLDLSDTTVAVLGASAEMGPLRTLLQWGCRVIALDLPSRISWQHLISLARNSSGTLIVPTRRPLPVDASDAEIAQHAGADVITESPEIADWLLRMPWRFILGDYVYASGSTHLRASTAIDAIIEHLLNRRDDIGLAYLATPTDVYIVPDTVAEASRQRFAHSGAWVSAVRGMTGGRLYRPNYSSISSTASGQRFAIADALVPQQGVNYALAKRVQRWRAQRARDRGTFVSVNVGPATTTASVLRSRLLATAYSGAHRFGLQIFEPQTSSTLMAALLVHDLRNPASLAHPLVSLDEPYRLFVDQALHGGMWRAPYSPRSVLGAAVIAGMVPRG